MTTLTQIQQTLARTAKPVSRRQIYRYIERLRIRPIGARGIPRYYPADTAARIAEHLGIPSVAQLADLRRRSLSAKRK